MYVCTATENVFYFSLVLFIYAKKEVHKSKELCYVAATDAAVWWRKALRGSNNNIKGILIGKKE